MAHNDHQPSLLLQCRPGLENDAAAEIVDRAAAVDLPGYCRAKPGAGYLLFVPAVAVEAQALAQALPFSTLVFARQWCTVLAELRDLPEQDRAAPVAAAVAAELTGYSELFLEHPDTNEGKSLSGFLRKFRRPLEAALTAAGVAQRARAPRLHGFFLDSRNLYLGLSDPANAAPWPLGIPRLRMPAGAPSRSTLKLDEAIRFFLGEGEQGLMQPGMTAVDLGAAPGGWTWQLARRGVKVAAVDNGPMAAAVMDTGLVEHLRADGFRYRPHKPVDWLVCDMVEQPSRVAELMGQWLARGDCRAAIFNLKLPMKKRWQAVQDALDRLDKHLARADRSAEIGCKQLYHDREEVTVCVRVTPGA